MLVAYGPDNQPIIANEAALEQLQRWSRERVLRCPNCRGIVHIRGGEGKMMQLHFAHQRGQCAWSTEAESVRHMRGKMVLAQWVREQFPQATVSLEERLPEPNRIADIFVTHPDSRQWAIEFQCAPLDYAEWRHRHNAYYKANIRDIWIVGDNRREKHESFIKAIFNATGEMMFLDPLATPPRLWLRWLIQSDMLQTHYLQQQSQVTLERRNSHGDYSATLVSTLTETQINAQGVITHSIRDVLEQQTLLLQKMEQASQIDETTLVAYLHSHIDDKVMHTVLIPLIKAYVRDPGLMRRYNYGRGLLDQPLSKSDDARVQKAQQWLERLTIDGYTKEQWQSLCALLPIVGSYASFARYVEMLLTLLPKT